VLKARGSILWPRMRSVWPLLLSVLLSTLIAASLVAAFAGFSATALPQAVSSELRGSAHRSITITGALDEAQTRADQRVVSATIRHAFGSTPFTTATGLWSDPLGLPAPTGAKTVPLVQAAALSRLSAHAKLTAGSWPGSAGGNPAGGHDASAATVAAAVPATVASTLGLHVGQVLQVTDRLTHAKVRIRLTGFFQPVNPAAAYWSLDLIPATGISIQPGFITYGPFAVSQSAFTGKQLTIGGATWQYGLATTRLPISVLTPLSTSITGALGHLANSPALGGLSVVSGLPAVLSLIATKLVVARSLLLVGELELLLLAGAALTLTARTLANQREEEAAIFSARGAGRRQATRLALTESLLITIVAAAIGAVLGSHLAGLLARSGMLRAAGINVHGIPADSWWFVGIVLLLCTAVMIWPALRSVTPIAARTGKGRRTTVALVASAGLDLALLVLAVLAGWQLRQFSVIGRTAGGLGIDPVLAVAPAIALAAGTVLPLRLLPMLARAGDRLAARTRRFGGAMTTWELARRATRQSAPMLLVVLAVGTSTLALAQHQSWHQSALDQSAFLTGADVRADTQAPATLASAGQIAHAPGVTAAMAVTTGLSVPGTGEVLALDARHAPSTVLLRSDEVAPGLWQQLIRPAPAKLITLPGRPARLQLTARLNPGPGPSLGQVRVSVSVLDADGVVYSVPAGTLPADGHAHRLVASLTATGRASYPLRLMSITATYTLPPPPAKSGRDAAQTRAAAFTVGGLATSVARSGAIATKVPAAALLGSWKPQLSAPDLNVFGIGLPPQPLTAPTGSAVPVRFTPGYGIVPANPPISSASPVQGILSLQVPLPTRQVPGVATAAFLHSNHLSVGQTVQLTDATTSNTVPINVWIVGEVKTFPTVTNSGGGLIIDEQAAQEYVAVQQQAPLPVTEWWLTTRSGAVPTGLPRHTRVVDRDVLAAAVINDPMAAIPQQAIQATAIAAALLAVLGFSVSVAGSVRERRSQTALLSALGVTGPTQARLLSLEALALSVPAALTGLLLGTVLAHLLVPAVTVTATAAAPAVPVLVKVPIVITLGIAVIVTAIPVLAAAAAAMYRPDPAAQLRASEAA
jgi:FtsX-like permease family protein